MPRSAAVAPVDWTIPKRPLGAHMSIAGGLDRAVERGAAIGATALQIFTKSSNQWAARPLAEGEAERFREAVRAAGMTRVVAHDSYLINLCSPDDALWRKSIDACALELERCALLGVPWLVTHPGGHMGEGETAGIRRMAEAIDLVHARVPATAASLALETTAGQGTVIGYRFEQIAALAARAKSGARLGVCLDTCHVFAAGYDLRTLGAYRETMRQFDGEIGLARLVAVHVNDSKRELGSRVDRHEHIGRGHLGVDAFRWLMNDERLVDRALVLETPKDEDCREDVVNLNTLIGLTEPRR
ncbi:MAG TPA: deoxyribonuclease IV [Patescibacteria group bacterium]|nr:deoxyribonuclease IV [Patescibacteria group bacterium]